MKENLDYVVRNKIGSTSHHDITLDNHTRHYENRIFPLDDEHALCMCRDVTDQVIVQQELEQANLRMVAAEDIALLSHWYYYEDIKGVRGAEDYSVAGRRRRRQAETLPQGAVPVACPSGRP